MGVVVAYSLTAPVLLELALGVDRHDIPEAAAGVEHQPMEWALQRRSAEVDEEREKFHPGKSSQVGLVGRGEVAEDIAVHGASPLTAGTVGKDEVRTYLRYVGFREGNVKRLARHIKSTQWVLFKFVLVAREGVEPPTR